MTTSHYYQHILTYSIMLDKYRLLYITIYIYIYIIKRRTETLPTKITIGQPIKQDMETEE